MLTKRGEKKADCKKEYEKAIQDYNQVIGPDPKDAIVYTSRGAAYYDLRKKEHACNDYEMQHKQWSMELNSLRWTNTSRQLMDWSIQFSDPRSWGTG
ncbi:MAG: tetratricopeptide repeat protein, partial [Deltaproteobacteria bacterium]|nr:tetratricopeptide repeat protein [Deltaproteobacteria bacterium]